MGFDTMTPLSVMNSANCEGCLDVDGFTYQRSYTIRKVSDEKLKFNIEGEEVNGVLVSDNVRLEKGNDDLQVKEFPFLLVNSWKQSESQNVNGVIGLSKSHYTSTGERSGPEFLESLFQAGVINNKIFAVHFDKFGGSTIEFGGYSPDKIVPNVPLTYLEIPY